MWNPWVKLTISGVLILGGGWTLYCLSPAGAAERQYTREYHQQQRQMYRKSSTENK